MVRQCAAGYLARVRRLVLGMDVLYEAEMPDVLGGVMRMCLEAWVTGMWVLSVGEDALTMLEADRVTQKNLLIERAGFDLEPEQPLEGAAALPKVWQRFEAVDAHLVAEGDANRGEIVWTYKAIYGAESGEGVHAGLASVTPRHLVSRPEWVGMVVDGDEAGDGSGKVLWAATLLAMLARRVFVEFGIGTADLDEVAVPIQQLAVSLNKDAPPLDFTQS
jgi:hypothetical protein